MRKFLLPALLALALSVPAFADETPKPDDRVAFDLSAEDWAMTKTARVTANVEAAVSGSNAGTMRADMLKAVQGLAQGDWRLTGFNRGQDQTGLERWSASFEARLPESALGGMADSAKKASKAGMQVTVGDVDFSPSLDETEAVKANLRTEIYKKAAEQLAALNTALPGRNYRIADIEFSDNGMPTPRLMRAPVAMAMMNSSVASDSAPDMQRSEKIHVSARVILAAVSPTAESKH